MHDWASVKQFACLTCTNTGSNYSGGAPFCERCQRYMVSTGFIPESKVVEIKNRKLNLTKGAAPKSKRGRKGRAEDDLIKRAVVGTVYARSSGGQEMKLAVNMDDEMFVRGSVMLKWGELSFMTSIYEIGEAFTPFDSTPLTTLRDDGVDLITGKQRYTQIKIPKEINKKITRIGPIEVAGGANRKAFDDMFATFTWGKQKAVFCMADICQVIAPAL